MPTLNLRDTGNFLARYSLVMHALGKDPDSEGDYWIKEFNDAGISDSTYNSNKATWEGLADKWGATSDPLVLTANSGGTWQPPIGDQPPRPHPRPRP